MSLWMILAWGATAAEPAPLALEVTVQAPPPAPLRATPAPQAALPVTAAGEITLDGRLDEAAWRLSVAPALGPLASGGSPPAIAAFTLTDDRGIYLGLEGLAEGETSQWVLDPDGSTQEWWRFALEDSGLSAQRCSLEEAAELPVEANLNLNAAVCLPAVGEWGAVRQGAQVEVFIPWPRAPLSSGKLLWKVETPSGGGTWATGGSPALLPSLGLSFDLPRASGVVGALLPEKTWILRMQRPAGSAAESLELELWLRGTQLDAVTLPVDERGWAEWRRPATDAVNAWLVARSGEAQAGVPLGGALRVRSFDWQATLLTPVTVERAQIWWNLSLPLKDAEVIVAGLDGSRVGSGRVDLPKGRGVLSVALDPEWGPVTVEVVGLLEPSLTVPVEVNR
ncbi:MAG: hypothetical protein JXX28_11565 [Deltaproteobacteria bacterium]|nr:hypothetical protein [Deltaproteobacteria bacterium]